MYLYAHAQCCRMLVSVACVLRADGAPGCGEWCESLQGLWQNNPPDFDAEMASNEALSLHKPHCCVCALFVPFKVIDHFILSSFLSLYL